MARRVPDPIEAALAAFARRVRLRDLATRSLGLFTVALGALALALLLARLSDGLTLWAPLKFALLAVLSGAFLWFILPGGPPGSKRSHGALVPMLLGSGSRLAEGLASVIELGDTRGSRDGVSAALAAAHNRSVEKRIRKVRLSVSLDSRGLTRWSAALLASLSMAALALTIAPQGFMEHLISPSLIVRSTAPSLELADVTVTYDYPAYAGLPGRVVRGSTGDLLALRGTRVGLRARLLGGAKSPELVINDSLMLSLEVDGDTIAAGFSITGPGTYRVEDRASGRVTKEFLITVVEDEAPVVSVEPPAGLSIAGGAYVVSWDDVIELEIRAEDDFGLSRLALMMGGGEGGEHERSLGEPPGGGKTHAEGINLLVSSLEGIERGGVELRIAAYDNDQVSGPKPGFSGPVHLRLEDAGAKHRETTGLLAALFEHMLDTLAASIEARPPDGLDKQQGIGGMLQTGIDRLGDVITSMEGDERADFTQYTALAAMRERLVPMLATRERVLEGMARGVTSMLAGQVAGEINELEGDVLFLSAILGADGLRESLDFGAETASLYEEIYDMLSELERRGGGDAELMRAIEEGLQRVEEMMERIAQRLARMAEVAPEGFMNPSAFGGESMASKLDELRRLMEEGRFGEALDLLAALDSDLAGMVASMRQGMEQMMSDALAEGMERLAEAVAKIAELEKAEGGVIGGADALRRSIAASGEAIHRSGEAREGMARLSGVQGGIRGETVGLASELDELSRDNPLPPESVLEALDEATRHMKGAVASFDKTEISKAHSYAEEAALALKRAREEAEGMLQRMMMSSLGNGPSVPMVMRSRMYDGTGQLNESFVEIPAEEDKELGRRFKEDILRALISESPEGFEELNRDYFKRIVR